MTPWTASGISSVVKASIRVTTRNGLQQMTNRLTMTASILVILSSLKKRFRLSNDCLLFGSRAESAPSRLDCILEIWLMAALQMEMYANDMMLRGIQNRDANKKMTYPWVTSRSSWNCRKEIPATTKANPQTMAMDCLARRGVTIVLYRKGLLMAQ